MNKKKVIKLLSYASIGVLLFSILHILVWSFVQGKNHNSVELELTDDSYSAKYVNELAESYSKDNNIVFWRQRDYVSLNNDDLNRTATAKEIVVYGDSSLIVNEGSAIWQNDCDSCVIGEQLDFDLFGSVQATGQFINYNGKDYKVIDVVKNYKDIFLYQADKNDEIVFDRVTALVKPEETKSKCVSRLSMQYGIYGKVIDYECIFFCIRMISILLVIVTLLYFARKIRKKICVRYEESEKICNIVMVVAFTVNILIVVIALSKLQIPLDYIPTSWSDYNFWGAFLKEKVDGIRDIMLMKKNYPDYGKYKVIPEFIMQCFIILVFLCSTLKLRRKAT